MFKITRCPAGKEYTKNAAIVIGDHIWKSLREQRKQKQFCDVQISCGSIKEYAHRCFLSSICPYFKTFFSKSKTHEGQYYQVDLSDFSHDTVKLFLDILYGQEETVDLCIELEDLLQLIDYLHADICIDIFAENLLSMVNVDNCLRLYELSTKFNSKKLKTISMVFIADNIKAITSSVSVQKLPKTLFNELLEYDIV